MTTTQITQGDKVQVIHPTGIRETGTVRAIRDMGDGMVQVDMAWADGTLSWVRLADIVAN